MRLPRFLAIALVLAACSQPSSPPGERSQANAITTGGGGLSKVAHDTTLSGNGTSGSPLTVLSSGGITNSAGANVVMKSDGTNAVASSIHDDGTTVSTTEAVSVGSFRGAVIYTTATGTQNNWAPTGNATATTIVQTSASDLTINGLVGGVDGRKITIYNNGTGQVNVVNGASGSTASNRFATTGTYTTSLYGASFGDTGCSAEFTYFAVDSFWHQTAFNCSTVYFLATSSGASIAPNGNLTNVVSLGASTVAGGTVLTGGFSGSTWSRNSGSPQGSVNCTVGDLYSRTDGSTSTTLYVCTATNTWTAK